MGKRQDLCGKRYGRLVVIKYVGTNASGGSMWLCKCDCGNEKTVRGSKLKSGWTKSCGCLQRECSRNFFATHNKSNTPIYKIWSLMKSRCYSPHNNRYYRYGARGIKVCDEWHIFENFYDWAIHNGYEEGLSIERRDNDGDYEPSNCCWIKRSEQGKNKSNNVWISYKGEKHNASEFGRMMGVSRTVVCNRAKRGMTGDEMAKEFNK